MSDHAPIHDPQLRMVRPDLRDLPPLDLPAGYVLRTFRPGEDEPGVSDTLKDAFDEPSMAVEWAVVNNRGFMPARSFVIERGGLIMASASMLFDPDSPAARREGTAFLHWVAARKSEAGKRLGYWVCLAVMHRMVSEGYRQAGLGTDDGRLAAVKTYLNLGFAPRIVHENQRARWRKIFDELGAPELKHQYADILDGPIHEF
ncbi:MAG: GNAT family N-acetyltransferase [Planctomycetota bacterium]|jgi:mycothiol synthase